MTFLVELFLLNIMSSQQAVFQFTDAVASYMHARFLWHLSGNTQAEPCPNLQLPLSMVLDSERLVQQVVLAFKNPSE